MKLEDFNVKQLKKIVSKYNHLVAIKGYSKLKKVDLIKGLRNSKKIKITETEKGVKIVVVNTIMEEDKEIKEKKPRKKKEKKKEKPKPLTLKQQADLIQITEEEEIEEPKKEKEHKADKFEFPKVKLKFKKDIPKIVITEAEENPKKKLSAIYDEEIKADKFKFPKPPKISLKKLPMGLFDELLLLRKKYEEGEKVFPTFVCFNSVSNFIYLNILENNDNACLYYDILGNDNVKNYSYRTAGIKIGQFNEYNRNYQKVFIPYSDLINNMKKYNLTFELPNNFKRLKNIPLVELGEVETTRDKTDKDGKKIRDEDGNIEEETKKREITGSYLGGFDRLFLEKDGIDKLYENYKECAKNNKILCIPMNIGTGIGDECNSTHRNMICINPNTKTFERYEPHGQKTYLGQNSLCYLTSEEYDTILKQIVDYWDKKYKLKLQYIPPNENCPKPKDLSVVNKEEVINKYTEEEAKELLSITLKANLDKIKTEEIYDKEIPKYTFIRNKKDTSSSIQAIIGHGDNFNTFSINTDKPNKAWIKPENRKFDFYNNELNKSWIGFTKKKFIKIAMKHYKIKEDDLEFYEAGDNVDLEKVENIKPDGKYIVYNTKVKDKDSSNGYKRVLKRYFKQTESKDEFFYPIRDNVKEFKELHKELGFQTLEPKEGRKSGEGKKTRVKIKTDSTELTIKEVGGYCCMWSFFLLDLRLKFPKLMPKTIFTKAYERLNKGKTPFLTFIRAYTDKFMEEMEKEIGGAYEFIESKYDDKIENKEKREMRIKLNEKLEKKLENYKIKINT
mgnify:CR=1 FL=1